MRAYKPDNTDAFGLCLFDGFFDSPLIDNNKRLLTDYAKILSRMRSFTYVVKFQGKVVCFICETYWKGLGERGDSHGVRSAA